MAYEDTLTTEQAFQRYQEIRSRLPTAAFPDQSAECAGLIDIADQVDAFFLDSFGVLNVGERAIPGAPERIAELRRMGKRLVVLTNAASYTKEEAIEKYRRLGFDFSADEIVSSRDVALRRLDHIIAGGRWGAIAAPEDDFRDIPADVRRWDGSDVDGVLMLSSSALTASLFAELTNVLRRKPMPVVVANPDLVAPREGGLSKEPGFFAHLLMDHLNADARFFGKPFGDAFDAAARLLPDIPRARMAMVGDTLHTDILGGCAAGMKTVLVRDHGLFAGADIASYIRRSGITPDHQCGAI